MQEKTICLGIDPGTRITGYGVVELLSSSYKVLDYGTIKPPPKDDLSKRYFVIFKEIEEIILEFSPTALAIESQFVKNNILSALKLGGARAAALIAAAKNHIPVFEYAPKKAKLAIVGTGNANKFQVQKMVEFYLKLPQINQSDPADALAIALCYLHEKKNYKFGEK